LNAAPSVIEPGHHSILVVDDDAAIRRLVATVLGRAGYVVEQAGDGIEAVLKLGVMDFDVIVLDLMMPNLDGFTFIETFGRHDPGALDRVIVTSAASAALIEERMGRYSLKILAKPFDIEELMSLVDETIRKNGRG
jgi:CheY-like chemotaxis protein